MFDVLKTKQVHITPIKPSRWLSRLTIVTLSSWLTLHATADIRCATVDVDEVLKNYQKVTEQIKSLLAKQEQYKERLTTLVSRRDKVKRSMASLRDEIDMELDASSIKKAYYDRALKLHDQERSLSGHIKNLEKIHLKQAQKDFNRLVNTSLGDIHKMIHQYALDQKYDWVIDVSGLTNS